MMRVKILCLLGLILLAVDLFAADPSSKALASVAVVRVRIQLAQDHADLPAGAVVPEVAPELGPAEVVPTRDKTADNDCPAQLKRALDENEMLAEKQRESETEITKSHIRLWEVEAELAESKKTLSEQSFRLAELQIPRETKVPDPIDIEPMSLTFIDPPKSAPSTKRFVTVYTGEKVHGKGWCQNCGPYHALMGNGNDDVEIEYSDELASGGPQFYPAVRFTAVDGREKHIADRPTSLKRLCEVIDRNGGSKPRENVAESGFAGTIQASQHIRSAKQYLRKYIGEGNSLAISWESNHDGKLSLYKMKDWKAEEYFGTAGRLQIDLPKSNLPMQQLGVGYRLAGRDLILDAEPLKLLGFVDRLSPSANLSQAMNPQPAGLLGIDDALLIYNVFSMLRDIGSLLRPSCDLILPGRIDFTVKLIDETIAVDFTRSPTVKIVALFTFPLQFVHAAFTEQLAHIDFAGSRFVKSREFDIQ